MLVSLNYALDNPINSVAVGGLCGVWSLHKKYGVAALVGIIRSLSGTASNSFGVRLSTSVNSRIEATLPQR